MKIKITFILALLPIIFSFAQVNGRVVRVTDGDTFTLLTQENQSIKVRLHGIDAPEAKQDYGQRAKQFLSDQIFGKNVYLENRGKDRYRRLIVIVHLDAMHSSVSVNEKLHASGMAWHYKAYDKNPAWTKLE